MEEMKLEFWRVTVEGRVYAMAGEIVLSAKGAWASNEEGFKVGADFSPHICRDEIEWASAKDLRAFAPLRTMPDRTQNNPVTANPIENNVRRAADYQLAYFWLDPHASKVRVMPQGFHRRDDSSNEALRRIRLVHGDESSNLPKPRSGQRRPDDVHPGRAIYRHRFSSS
jgi:hypothetical protein